MAKFEFTLIASGLDPETGDLDARFLDGRCADAKGSFQHGRVVLDFRRDAPTLADAIISAAQDVADAGAVVTGVEPDSLVILADMAARSGMSRAAMSQYSKGRRQKGFPAPKRRVTSPSPLWDWADIARWLFRQGRMSRDDAFAAGVISAANELLQDGVRKLAAKLHRRAQQVEDRLA